MPACGCRRCRVLGQPQHPAPRRRRLRRCSLVAAGGGLKVEALAAEVGWSRRHFTARFHREVGPAPRQLARVLRFERSHALLAMASRPAPADIAVQCGYYDQPHVNREWRDLAGCSPTQWLVEEQLPSVQDTAEYRSAH